MQINRYEDRINNLETMLYNIQERQEMDKWFWIFVGIFILLIITGGYLILWLI